MASRPGSIRTVLGELPAADLSGALCHEHVWSLLPGESSDPYQTGDDQARLDFTARAVRPLLDAGINTVVNLSGATHLGSHWTWPFLQEVSRVTDVHIIAGFAYYTERHWPAPLAGLSTTELTDTFVAAAERIGDSTVAAGAYGEIATSFRHITEGEERCLRAVAQAQRSTGLPIFTHASLGTMASEQVDILSAAGADLEQVVIGHVDLAADVATVEALLTRGVFVAFDTFGKEAFDYVLQPHEQPQLEHPLKRVFSRPDSKRFDCIVELLRRGWARQILLSTDYSGAEAFMNPSTHGRHGYAYLKDRVLPELRHRGIEEELLHTMITGNPRAVLSTRR